MTPRTMSAGLGSMAMLGLFSLIIPRMVEWASQYQAFLGATLSAEYPLLSRGELPQIFVAALLFAMLAVLWPVE